MAVTFKASYITRRGTTNLSARCITQIGYSCSLDIALELDILFLSGSSAGSICDHYSYIT